MKSKGKVAFTAIEALVALGLFSAMMAIYLPGYYQQLAQVDSQRQASQEWRVFYELVDRYWRGQPGQVEVWIKQYNQGSESAIVFFDCQAKTCRIDFDGRPSLEVKLMDGGLP